MEDVQAHISAAPIGLRRLRATANGDKAMARVSCFGVRKTEGGEAAGEREKVQGTEREERRGVLLIHQGAAAGASWSSWSIDDQAAVSLQSEG